MKTLKLALLAAVGVAVMGSAAQAEDRPLGLTFNIGASTNYMFRGISQTNDRNGEVFGGADVTIATIGYAGTWLSNVDFGNGTRMEYDIYAGVKPTLGPVAFDFGVIRYGYTNQPPGSHEDYYEWKALASVPVGPATIGVAYYYSDNNFGGTGPSAYSEINLAVPIPDSKFTVNGAFGHQEVKGAASDYNTWNAGVGYAVTDNVGLDVRYWDTDEHSFGKIFESKFVATVKVTY
jgi:uncharacterized protein (TIGR02001 family)